MLSALDFAKPCLPRYPCRKHEPEPVDERFVRRVTRMPCPACWAASGKKDTNFISLKRMPFAEPGKGGFGLKVRVELEHRIEYELGYLGKQIVWRVTNAVGKKGAKPTEVALT